MMRGEAADTQIAAFPLRAGAARRVGRGAARRAEALRAEACPFPRRARPSSTPAEPGETGLHTVQHLPPRPRLVAAAAGFRLRNTETAPYRAARGARTCWRRSAPISISARSGCARAGRDWIHIPERETIPPCDAPRGARADGSRHPDPLQLARSALNPAHATHQLVGVAEGGARRDGGGGTLEARDHSGRSSCTERVDWMSSRSRRETWFNEAGLNAPGSAARWRPARSG